MNAAARSSTPPSRSPIASLTADQQLNDMLDELTTAHRHREHVTQRIGSTTYGSDHVTVVPPLLWQLEHAEPSGNGSSRSGAGFESRPVVRVEAVDTLVRIDLAASRWVRDLGEDDPGSTAACVRRLAGLLPSVNRCHRSKAKRHPKTRKPECCTWHAIEDDVRQWWTQARVITGWSTPAWRPDATCPMCGVRGGLRVRLEDRAAVCTGCQETWDSGTYQQLAAHVRSEFDERRKARLHAVDDQGDVTVQQNRGW